MKKLELVDKEEVVKLLEEHIENQDSKAFFETLGKAARKKGMTYISKEAGVTRERLYTSLSNKGNPSFSTVFKVLNSLGFTINIKQKKYKKDV